MVPWLRTSRRKTGIQVITDLLTQWIGLSLLQRVSWTNTRNTTEILSDCRFPWCLLTHNGCHFSSVVTDVIRVFHSTHLQIKNKLNEQQTHDWRGCCRYTGGQNSQNLGSDTYLNRSLFYPIELLNSTKYWVLVAELFSGSNLCRSNDYILTSQKKIPWRSRRMAKEIWPWDWQEVEYGLSQNPRNSTLRRKEF